MRNGLLKKGKNEARNAYINCCKESLRKLFICSYHVLGKSIQYSPYKFIRNQFFSLIVTYRYSIFKFLNLDSTSYDILG